MIPSKKLWKQSLRLASVGLSIGALLLLSLPQVSQAAYSNRVTSSGGSEKMTAGSIDAELSVTDDFNGTAIGAGEMDYVLLEVLNSGVLGLEYQVTAQKTTGDDDLFNNLEAELLQDKTTQWTGLLKDLAFTSPELSPSASHEIEIRVSLPADAASSLEELTTEFEIKVTASQFSATNGWIDQEILSGKSITSSDWTAPDVPQNLGFNVESQSSTPNEGNPVAANLDLDCTTTGTVYTNENSVAHNWTDESASDSGPVKYERLVTYPDRRTNTFGPHEDNYTPFSSFGGGGGIEGTWGVQVRSYDDTGNYSAWSDKCEIVYDQTAPTVAITSPANGDPVSGIVPIQADIVDDNLQEYQLIIQDSSRNNLRLISKLENSSLNEKVIYNWNTADVDPGDYTFLLSATDAAGNSTAATPVTVTVANPFAFSDIQDPLLTATGTEDGANDYTALFSWKTVDPNDETILVDTTDHRVICDEDSHSAHQEGLYDLGPGQLISSSPGEYQLEIENIKEGTLYCRIVSADSPLGVELISEEFSFSTSAEGVLGYPNPGDVVLNEVLPNPSDDEGTEEWVELYNTTADPIQLKGAYLKDAADHQVPIDIDHTASDSTVIPANDYLVVYPQSGGGLLNNGGDTVGLYDKDDNLLDEFTYTSTIEDKTFARLPDGHGPWIDPEPTPGDDNDLTKQEKKDFKALSFEDCFQFQRELQSPDAENHCHPEFLEIIGLLEDKDDDKINSDLFEELLKEADIETEDKKKNEEKKDGNEEGSVAEKDAEYQNDNQKNPQEENNSGNEQSTGTDTTEDNAVEKSEGAKKETDEDEDDTTEETESEDELIEAQLEVKFEGDLETTDELAWEIKIDQDEFTVSYPADRQNDFENDFPKEELAIDLEDLDLEKVKEATKLEVFLKDIEESIDLPDYLEITEPDPDETRIAKIKIFEVKTAQSEEPEEGQKEESEEEVKENPGENNKSEESPEETDQIEELADRKGFFQWLISQKSTYLS